MVASLAKALGTSPTPTALLPLLLPQTPAWATGCLLASVARLLADRLDIMSSGDYYVGRPATYTAPEPPPAAPEPSTKQAPQVTGAAQQAPATHNYFVGPPENPEKTQQPKELAASPTPHPPPKNRSTFLARCFPCICGSRASVQ